MSVSSFRPAPKPVAPPKPPKGLRKKNAARAASEFERCYLSRARQKWVRLQPCSACGVWGYSDNAHLLGVDGASLKGSYKEIGPLCGVRPDGNGGVYEGCHRLFDTARDTFNARFPRFNPNRAAKACERAWRAFLNGVSNG